MALWDSFACGDVESGRPVSNPPKRHPAASRQPQYCVQHDLYHIIAGVSLIFLFFYITTMPPKRRQKLHKQQLEQSDYDSEAYHTDAAAQAYAVHAPKPPPRDSDELNLAVLRRWNPEVVSIKSKASMAVVYTCSTETGQWERADIEGPLFICELVRATLPIPDSSLLIERYKLVILNRKNMQNFSVDLRETAQLDVNDSLIMFSPAHPGEPLYGLWIYAGQIEADNQMTKIARTLFDCARSVEKSVQLATDAVAESYEHEGYDGYGEQDQYQEQERDQSYAEHYATTDAPSQPQHHSEGHRQQSYEVPTAGQQIDMRHLFGQPQQQGGPSLSEVMQMRQQVHDMQQQQLQQLQRQHQQLQERQNQEQYYQQQQQQQYHHHGHQQPQQFQGYPSGTHAPSSHPPAQQNALLNLFRNAR